MNEAFDEWKAGKPQVRGNGYSLYFDEWHERDVTDFVQRDRNHPSVVLWSCGNEIGDQLTRARRGASARPAAHLPPRGPHAPGDRRLRPDRRRTQAGAGGVSDLLDIVGYNYVDRWRERRELYYSIDKAAHPNWRMIGTESSGMGGIRGDYRWLFRRASAQASPLPGRPHGGASARGLDTEELWKFVGAHDYVAGDFMWTGIDYLGESRWPSHGAAAGCIDSCGFPKDGYYFYQSQWTEKPMLHLFPHWNWKGREGQFLPVTCYTNCDNVELFLNGKSVGVKGYAFPALRHAGALRPAGAAEDERRPHHQRSAPCLGRALRTRHAQGRGDQKRADGGDGRDRDHRRSGGDRARRGPGDASARTGATWRT